MLVLTVPSMPAIPTLSCGDPGDIGHILPACQQDSPSFFLLAQSACHVLHFFLCLQHLLAAWPGSFTVDLPCISHALAIKSINRIKENPTHAFIMNPTPTPVGSLAWELHCRFALCLPYSCHQKSILHSILYLNSAALIDS